MSARAALLIEASPGRTAPGEAFAFDRAVRRILRVNHGGEHGAIHIYRAQLTLARLTAPDLQPFLRATLAHEIDHRARFAALMPARGARPCRLGWLWAAGALVLGGGTGLLGRTAILICTEAVERTVHRHLDEQLRFLGARDRELHACIADIGLEELQHLAFAQRGRGADTTAGRLLDRLVTVATEMLIWLSTRGDSVRLSRVLASQVMEEAG